MSETLTLTLIIALSALSGALFMLGGLMLWANRPDPLDDAIIEQLKSRAGQLTEPETEGN